MQRPSSSRRNSGEKQITAVLGLLGYACIAGAQGLVNFSNPFVYLSSTNQTCGGPVAGVTRTNVPSYYYALFWAHTNVTDPAVFGFSGCYATNTSLSSGGRFSGGTSVAIGGAAAGLTINVLIRGWSSNLGPTWEPVRNILLDPCIFCGPYWYDESPIATILLGGFDGITMRPPASLFGTQPGLLHTGMVFEARCDLVAPAITAQPTNTSVVVGSSAAFSVTAAGPPPLSYKWRKAEADIAGATNAFYGIPSTTAADAGDYDVIAYSPCCGLSATSEVATLTILFPPKIEQPPTNRSVTVGSNVTFTVTASGTEPLSYEWRTNGICLDGGANVSGARTPTLTLTNVQMADAGNYSVLVTNLYGSATSAVAVLTVSGAVPETPPEILTNDGSFGFLTNGFGFSVSAVAGQTVVVERSADLLDWGALATNIVVTNPFYFCDPASSNSPAAFYRARLQK